LSDRLQQVLLRRKGRRLFHVLESLDVPIYRGISHSSIFSLELSHVKSHLQRKWRSETFASTFIDLPCDGDNAE
jgi:hypothetical protein